MPTLYLIFFTLPTYSAAAAAPAPAKAVKKAAAAPAMSTIKSTRARLAAKAPMMLEEIRELRRQLKQLMILRKILKPKGRHAS